MYNSALEILCILCIVKFDFLEDVYLVLDERMPVFGGPDASIWRIGCQYLEARMLVFEGSDASI